MDGNLLYNASNGHLIYDAAGHLIFSAPPPPIYVTLDGHLQATWDEVNHVIPAAKYECLDVTAGGESGLSYEWTGVSEGHNVKIILNNYASYWWVEMYVGVSHPSYLVECRYRLADKLGSYAFYSHTNYGADAWEDTITTVVVSET